MHKRFIYILFSLLASFQPVNAGSVVVELFTSQGCSSCPPADSLLHELSKDPDIISLAYHVPYWDYIGWADSFARKEHGVRQEGYAYRARTKRIVTPQFIIHGEDVISGTHPMKIIRRIETHKKKSKTIDFDMVESGGQIVIQAETKKAFLRPINVFMLEIYPPSKVTITRGENKGKTFTYRNVVKETHTIGQWSGKNLFQMQLKKPQGVSIVILFQEPDFGPILAAGALESR